MRAPALAWLAPKLRIAVLASAILTTSGNVDAETVKIGLLREGALTGPIYIAKDRGHFVAEGLDCEIIKFDAALPVSVAVVSGDIDVAVTGLSAGFYKLASQGSLRIIAGYGREAPTFHALAVVASKSAYADGLTGPAKLGGHSVAITQIGGSSHYSLGLLAEKYGFDVKTVTLLPLQSNPNATTAVIGGRADAGIIPGRYVLPALAHGDVKLLAWIGDEVPWQLGAVITTAKSVREKADMIARFLHAYRKGVRDFHDAFTGPDERRQDGPSAMDVLQIMAKYTDSSIELLETSIGYIDADARLDVADIGHQIAWYKSQNLLSGDIRMEELVVSIP
jgi:NitT/TauT family transport system substrate-binding protein